MKSLPLLPLAGLAAAVGLYAFFKSAPAGSTASSGGAAVPIGALPAGESAPFAQRLDPNSDDARAIDTIAKIAKTSPSAIKPDAVISYAHELASEGYQVDSQRLLDLLQNV